MIFHFWGSDPQSINLSPDWSRGPCRAHQASPNAEKISAIPPAVFEKIGSKFFSFPPSPPKMMGRGKKFLISPCGGGRGLSCVKVSWRSGIRSRRYSTSKYWRHCPTAKRKKRLIYRVVGQKHYRRSRIINSFTLCVIGVAVRRNRK